MVGEGAHRLFGIGRLAPKDFAVALVILFCLFPVLFEVVPAIVGQPQWRAYLTGGPLFGYTEQVAPMQWSWWDRAFQSTFAAHFNVRLRVRNPLVRANNQLDYWILAASRMHAGQLVIGRGGALFERRYIEEAFGYAPDVPDDAIRRAGDQIKRLHDVLAQRGIAFIAVGTPGKASLARAAIPWWFHDYHPEVPRNYDRLVKIFAEANVPFVDGRGEIRSSPLATRSSIYPVGGTHWTLFGTYLGTRKAIARLLHQVDPSRDSDVVLDGLLRSETPYRTDVDLLQLANLAWSPHYDSWLPQLHLEGTPLAKPVSVVGSSYSEQIGDLLKRAGVAPEVRTFYYLKWFSPCEDCAPEPMPDDWSSRILDDSSAVILEINETVFFSSLLAGTDYVATLVSGIAGGAEAPATSHPVSDH